MGTLRKAPCPADSPSQIVSVLCDGRSVISGNVKATGRGSCDHSVTKTLQFAKQQTAGLSSDPSVIHSALAGRVGKSLQLPKPDAKLAKRRETHPVTRAQDCHLGLGGCSWDPARDRRDRGADPQSWTAVLQMISDCFLRGRKIGKGKGLCQQTWEGKVGLGRSLAA